MDRESLSSDQIQPFLWKSLREWVVQSRGTRNPNGETPQGIASRAAIEMVTAGLLPELHPAVDALRPGEKALFEEMMWDLACQGILHLGAARSEAWQHLYKPTTYGIEVLKKSEAEPTPYDPDGYIRSLHQTVGRLDPVIVSYLEEALDTFRRRNFLASLAMLGAASEQALLLLCRAYYQGFDEGKSASSLFKGLRSDINNKGAQYKRAIAAAAQDDWAERLEGGFNIIRQSRNDAGHPARMEPVSRVVVRDRLLIFTSYVETVYSLIRHFKEHC